MEMQPLILLMLDETGWSYRHEEAGIEISGLPPVEREGLYSPRSESENRKTDQNAHVAEELRVQR